jgi:lipoate-protein ligase A
MRLVVDLTPRAAARGLAMDEALFESARSGGEDAVRIWLSRRAVVVGRSQAVASECDRDALARLGIPVVRRVSGGGAVYHYPGNLNVSVTLSDGRRLGSVDEAFTWLGRGVAAGVRGLGIDAEAQDRSVRVAGVKISGEAQARRGAAVLVHATLLVRRDKFALGDLLLAMQAGYEPGGTRSHASETTTLSDALGRRVAISRAAAAIADSVAQASAATLGRRLVPGTISPAEVGAARRWLRERYGRREWNEAH